MPLDADLAPRSVTATLNYLTRTGERPRRYVDQPPPGTPQWNGVNEPRQVAIADARGREQTFTLDRNGFAFLREPTAVTDFSDEAQIRDVYYPEIERFLARELGASRVFVFDHTVRNAAGGRREPVQRVHNDYTEKSAPQRVRDFLGDEADERLQTRFAMVNVWRPIRNLVVDWPLALCDAETASEDDLIMTDLVYADRVGEIASVAFRPQHRWYYLSRMRPDEVVLIKCHDSARDGRARLSFHSAFKDPSAPADAPPRESIEIRTLVFFPREK